MCPRPEPVRSARNYATQSIGGQILTSQSRSTAKGVSCKHYQGARDLLHKYSNIEQRHLSNAVPTPWQTPWQMSVTRLSNAMNARPRHLPAVCLRWPFFTFLDRRTL